AAKLFVTTTAQSLMTGQCSTALTFERRDQFDNSIIVPSALAVALSGTGGISFYASAGCSGATIASTQILANAASVTVFFKSPAPNTQSVTGAGAGVPTPGTQQENIS